MATRIGLRGMNSGRRLVGEEAGPTSEGFGLGRCPDRFDGGRHEIAQENTYEAFPAEAHERDQIRYRIEGHVFDPPARAVEHRDQFPARSLP